MFIADPTTGTKEGGGELVVLPFFCSHKYHIIENYLLKEQYLSQFTKNYGTVLFLPKKMSLSSQNYEFGIRDSEYYIPDPGVKIQQH
jgi:hypothetical protein